MHFSVKYLVALAFFIANATSSPVEQSSAGQVLESPDNTQPQDADSVLALPYDADSSMTGTVERDFNIVSSPPKVIPRSVEGLSMSGLLPPPRRIVKSRTGESVTSADDFNPVSSPPKTRPSHSRRANVWNSGFIGKLMDRLVRKRQSETLTPYEQNGPSTYGTPQMEKLPAHYGGSTTVPWGNVTTTNANPYK